MGTPTLVPVTDESGTHHTLLGGAYDVIRRLGKGAMGTVYLAHDVVLDRKVAVKTATRAQGPKIIETLRHEAAALARVESPFVVRIHAFGAHAEHFYYVMEHVDGPSLRTLLSELGSAGEHIPVSRVATLLRQVGQGLGDIHRAGFVHRDIKPENVVVQAGTGKPVLVDFGLAARIGSPLKPGIHGTVGYMPPEIIERDDELENNPRLDVYGLGALAYEALTGQPAYTGREALAVFTQQIAAPPPRPSAVRSELAPFDEVVAKAMARDPRERHSDGDEFARAIEEAAGAVRVKRSNHGIARPRAVGVPQGKLQILVVEDDDASRTFFVRAARLAFTGHEVEVRAARSGAEALLMAEQHMPHLLLLDYQLPGLDGISMLSELRDHEKGGQARVIVLTANLPESDNWRFEALGVEHIMRKPVALKGLVDQVLAVATREKWISLAT